MTSAAAATSWFRLMGGGRSAVAAAATVVTVSAATSFWNDRLLIKDHVGNDTVGHPQSPAMMHTSNDSNVNNSNNMANDTPIAVQQQTLLPSPASPTLPIRFVKPNPNLEIAFDVRTRTPIYVLETLTKDCLLSVKNNTIKKQQQQQRPNFYEDTGVLEEEYRSKLSHYRNSGWDRGHMAPAADYTHTAESDERASTFTLCNVAPQHHVLNLTVWNVLEEWVRRKVVLQEQQNITTTNTKDTAATVVYVVTGPLWLPHQQINETTFEYRYPAIGRAPSLVAVPTHFFKVVAVVANDNNNNKNGKKKRIRQFACFVMPNHGDLPSKRLEDYVVPWRDLETVTGLQFFPQWATPAWKDQADYLTRQQVVDASKKQQQSSKQKQLENNNSNVTTESSSSSPTMLLLTDGRSIHQTSTRTLWKRVRNSATGELPIEDLQHLCAFGNCR